MRNRPPPRAVNAAKLADARAPEVEALYSIIKKRMKLRKRKREEDAQDFTVPRSQRRRTTSYLNRKGNLWKKRKRDALKRFNRFKTKTSEDSGHDQDAEKLKKLCRRVRRRIELKGGSDGGFGYSRDGTARLVTHVWHAKRFKMIKKWGYYLPLGFFGRGRGSRALLKWSKSSALLHDASYFSAVQLEGPEGSLLKVLRMVLEPSPPSVAAMSEMQRAELRGVCYGTAMLNKLGGSPHGSIAPVMYLWCNMHKEKDDTVLKDGCLFNNDEKNENNQTRYLWIWIHAAGFDDAFNTLQSACQRQNEKDGIQLMCLPRTGELGRVDVLGSKALQLLQKILHPISRLHDHAEGFQFEGSLNCNGLSTSQISQLSEAYLLAHADKLPNNALLSMEVYDPRDTPSKQHKYLPRGSSVIQDDQTQRSLAVVSNKGDSGGTNVPSDVQMLGENENEETVSLSGGRFTFTASKEEAQNPSDSYATHMANKTLWDSQSKGLHVDPPLSEHLLSKKRHRQRIAFFHLEDHLNEEGLGSAKLEREQEKFSRTCPILLLKNDNKTSSACGWSIILPISWVRAFWIPLVLAGAHAIGLRERRWLSNDAGLPSFPYDFPDCKAYEDHMKDEAAASEETIARRPPSKRPPSILVPRPWHCIQRSVQTGCHGGVDMLVNITETESGILASENGCEFGSGRSVQNKFEILEKTRNTDLSSSQKTDSCFPGFIARTTTILRQHLREINGLHLLLFPETSISGNINGKTGYFRLMEEGRLVWSLKGSNNLVVDRKPCFLRVLLYATRKGAFEEGAIVCAPMENDFTSWCSRSQGWKGLEIPPTLRNADCRQLWMGNREIMQSADVASTCGKENLRMPIGFVTTGVCQGSVPAVAVAFCEGTILGQLRAEQWNETKWRKKSEIFVLVRNLKSTVYRPALAAIVLEEIKDTVYS